MAAAPGLGACVPGGDDTDPSGFWPAVATYLENLKKSPYFAAPVFKNGAFIGVVALQLSNEEIYALARGYTGLGETGEILLFASVGAGMHINAFVYRMP